jgi:hypothetical protein
MGAAVNRGEIWNFRFDRPDKQRPVLILTRQERIGVLYTVTVAPLTGTIMGSTPRSGDADGEELSQWHRRLGGVHRPAAGATSFSIIVALHILVCRRYSSDVGVRFIGPAPGLDKSSPYKFVTRVTFFLPGMHGQNS